MPNPRYNTLLGHIKHHGIRRWLMDGAEREDANTIKSAIQRCSDGELERGLARTLRK